MSFTFTPEQLENLKNWRQYLETEEAKLWQADVNQAVIDYNRILQESGFASGKDLTGDQFDQLFRHMKRLSHNRALSKLLYDSNGLPEFNKGLRSLLFGSKTLPERVDEFFDLQGVGEVVMSQFLCLKKPSEYPFFSAQTYDVLGIDATQEEQALRDAMTEYGLSDADQYLHQRTSGYLQHTVVFRTIKQTLGLENYYMINEFLWNATNLAEGDEIPQEQLTSVSIEKDLRDYLAGNPSVLERGLELVGKEYDTKQVGRIDILFKDRKGTFVVVETKKERDSDKVLGQTARYMGWAEKNLKGSSRAIIVVGKRDERLDYAVAPFISKIQLKYYQVRFDISDKPTQGAEDSS